MLWKTTTEGESAKSQRLYERRFEHLMAPVRQTETDTETKNGLYVVVLRCSYCTKTETDIMSDANGFQTILWVRSLYRYRSLSA